LYSLTNGAFQGYGKPIELSTKEPVSAAGYKIYELEKVAPQIWNIKFGDCSIEYPNDPKNYLYHLGIGKFITGYWLKMKYRYSLKFTEE